MYQTRQNSTTKLPINRKGTKYVVKALSHPRDSVPVAIAVRDMLKLASTAREVKEMIKDKTLKVNGQVVWNYAQSIKLFNLFEAGKTFRLTLLPTGKFSFEEVSKNESRLCKVVNKKLINGNQIQINLHDGTNLITKSKINVSDSVYLDNENKIKSHVIMEKGKKVFVLSGKYVGLNGSIKNIQENKVTVNFDKEASAELNKYQLIVL